MKKQLLIVFLTANTIIALMGLGMAVIHEGDIYTQAQYDTVDFATLDLQCQYHGFTIKPIEDKINFDFSCLSAKKQEDNTYLVFRLHRLYPLSIKVFLGCALHDPITTCINRYRGFILNQFWTSKTQLRKYLQSMQTNNVDIEQGDINFTQGELNSH